MQDSLPFKTRYGKDVQLYLKKDSCMNCASVSAKEMYNIMGRVDSIVQRLFLQGLESLTEIARCRRLFSLLAVPAMS